MTDKSNVAARNDRERQRLERQLETSLHALRLMQWFLHMALEYQKMGIPIPEEQFETAFEIVEGRARSIA
jgi:Trm5-related predicted tRNA methylase